LSGLLVIADVFQLGHRHVMITPITLL